MPASEAVVLIAAPPPVVNKLKAGLEHVQVIGAGTYEEALASLRGRRVDLLVVCYVFDSVRPYRLLNHLADLDAPPPAILVRALQVPLREQEEQVRAAYVPLGVREFQDFADLEKRQGTKVAQARFARIVSGLVSVLDQG